MRVAGKKRLEKEMSLRPNGTPVTDCLGHARGLGSCRERARPDPPGGKGLWHEWSRLRRLDSCEGDYDRPNRTHRFARSFDKRWWAMERAGIEARERAMVPSAGLHEVRSMYFLCSFWYDDCDMALEE